MGLNFLWAGLAIWLAAIWAGIGIGIAWKWLLDALSRNPELEKKYMIYGILAMALSEATAIYALVVAFMLMWK